jgi:hypothetical protein
LLQLGSDEEIKGVNMLFDKTFDFEKGRYEVPFVLPDDKKQIPQSTEN